MNVAHKIVNLDGADHHMHTSTFSDGLNTIEEVVIHAGKIGLQAITITDHSQACLDRFADKCCFYRPGARWSIKSWKNVHNDVVVDFGVEGDLLDESGEICVNIQGDEPDFRILSAHRAIYRSDPHTVTDGTIRAIERYHEKIAFIAHPCNNNDFGRYYDIEKLVHCANEYQIPLEINAKNIMKGKTNLEKLHLMIETADMLYVNSDAHTLYELQEARPFAITYLKEQGYL